jgi:hypothetical protein
MAFDRLVEPWMKTGRSKGLKGKPSFLLFTCGASIDVVTFDARRAAQYQR